MVATKGGEARVDPPFNWMIIWKNL